MIHFETIIKCHTTWETFRKHYCRVKNFIGGLRFCHSSKGGAIFHQYPDGGHPDFAKYELLKNDKAHIRP